MMENDDKLIARFFEEHGVEIEDNNFSNRVMRRLPDRTRRIGRLWTLFCTVAGVVLLFVMDWMADLAAIFKAAVGELSNVISLFGDSAITPGMMLVSILIILTMAFYNFAESELL